mmetsp:Transcript_5955/g.10998  ORF Transcript_5955/g.10998 Transcript_5955/m.10998 type:complete len:254 (-) Transcript_5955:532-1293(-)
MNTMSSTLLTSSTNTSSIMPRTVATVGHDLLVSACKEQSPAFILALHVSATCLYTSLFLSAGSHNPMYMPKDDIMLPISFTAQAITASMASASPALSTFSVKMAKKSVIFLPCCLRASCHCSVNCADASAASLSSFFRRSSSSRALRRLSASSSAFRCLSLSSFMRSCSAFRRSSSSLRFRAASSFWRFASSWILRRSSSSKRFLSASSSSFRLRSSSSFRLRASSSSFFLRSNSAMSHNLCLCSSRKSWCQA